MCFFPGVGWEDRVGDNTKLEIWVLLQMTSVNVKKFVFAYKKARKHRCVCITVFT